MEEKMKTFEEILEEFKKNESVEDVLPVMDNLSLQKILIAWSKISISRLPIKKAAPSIPNELWRWLWDQIEFKQDEITEITGIKFDLSKLLKILIGNRIIYPDGSISSFASKILKSILKTKLKI